MNRAGNAALILIVVAAVGGGGYLVTSPDTAQDVLPPVMLPMLPQFEQAEMDVSCAEIQEAKESAASDYINTDKLVEDLTGAGCSALCQQEYDAEYTDNHCSQENLACVCRTG